MSKLENIKAKFRSFFNDSQWEALKEVSRWIVFLVAADVATQLLNQAIRVPESLVVKFWIFDYMIPARMIFTTLLTLLLRYFDKLKHLNFRTDHPRSEKAGGLLPW